jgi:hypothetical protein
MGRREPLTADFDGCPGQGEANRDLVGGDLVTARDPDSVVTGQHEEDAHRDRVSRARDHHRHRE